MTAGISRVVPAGLRRPSARTCAAGSEVRSAALAVPRRGQLVVTTVVQNGFGVLTRDGDWHAVVEDPREHVLASFTGKLESGTAEP